MSWFDRKKGILDVALKNGSITQGEYDSVLSSVQGQWDTRQQNMANFNKAAGPLSFAGSVVGQFSNTQGSIDDSTAQAREGMRGAIGQIGPWGAAIAAATGVVDTVSDATGIALNTVDKNAADRADAGAAAGFNNLVASLPGFSFLGGLTGKTDDALKSQFIDGMSNSYGGSVQDINAAQDLGGKRTLFGKKKMNSFIQKQNRVNNLMTSIGMQSELAKQNDAGQLYQQQNANKYAGYSPRLLMSKKGMKFQDLDAAREILKNIKKTSAEPILEIGKFQLGGKIDKNFIPQGALHKNKHHLEDVNPELEGSITKKGIPVISMNEGGEIQQHAEVEKNEIVFSLDTTKTVEDLYRQYQETEDESILIECGKFITNEIMKNTEDPGKLRKTIE